MKPSLINNYPKTLLFCSGCLSALAMAPVYAWPLLIAGYSLLIYTLVFLQKNAKQNALLTFLFFLGFFLTSLYWVSSSLFIEFERWWWALPFSFAGLPFLLSLFPAITVGIATLAPRFKITLIIIALIAADYLRSFILTGFPWNLPAHGFINFDALTWLLPHIGFSLFNALIVLLCCLPALILLKIQKPLAYSLIGFYVFLGVTINFIDMTEGPYNTAPENIIMVQGNIPQQEKWDSKYKKRNLKRYITLSRDSLNNGDRAALIIWPETAISQSMLNNPDLAEEFYTFLNSLPEGSHLVTGYLYSTQQGHFNALAVVNTKGDIVDIYNKHHLVPFGEFMPFGIDTLTGVSNFQRGFKPQQISLTENEQAFLPLICYEIIFSSYSAQATKGGVIINITNDAWFGNTAGPHQHFDHAVFRAIENKATVLRLSGNGLSGIITPSGEPVAKTKLNKIAIISN